MKKLLRVLAWMLGLLGAAMLIGLRGKSSARILRPIEWSTSRVLEQTLVEIRRCGFSWLATTRVVMPPRTPKLASTVIERGANAATRSSKMRLVTASWKWPSSRNDHR